MTDGLSRRDLVALGSASLLASACGSNDGNTIDAAKDKDILKIESIDDWGKNPYEDPPTVNGKPIYGDFKPKFITLLYLGLLPNWTVRVNHAAYPYEVDSHELRAKKAAEIFANLVDAISFKLVNEKPVQTKADARFSDQFMQNNYQSYVRQNEEYKGHTDSTTLDNFRFLTQNEIFIFLHQVDLFPDASTVITLDPKRLLSFGSRTQAKGSGGPKPAERNYSFFSAKVVDGGNLFNGLLNRVGKMISVDNYVKNEDGAAIDKDQPYSMNIHFTIPGVGVVKFPMVFDPETGNGTGNEP